MYRSMADVWTHKYVAKRSFPSWENGAEITVEAGLHKIGEQRPYFSVTASITTPRSRRRGDIDAGGCMHDEILRMFPRLAPVIALHLSDDTGTPMHAEGNGWYYLAGYYGGAGEDYHVGNSKQNFPHPTPQYEGQTEHRFPTPEECLRIFADHVRIDIEEARILADQWRRDTPDLLREGGRTLMAQWIKAQAERWQKESDEAVALLEELKAEQAGRKVARS